MFLVTSHKGSDFLVKYCFDLLMSCTGDFYPYLEEKLLKIRGLTFNIISLHIFLTQIVATVDSYKQFLLSHFVSKLTEISEESYSVAKL